MGTLYIVSTPIGNLNDITKRAIDTLKKADIILCEDTRTSMKLLNHFDIKNKLVSYHKYNEQETKENIINKLKENNNIALISDAGTPCISDPGYILVKEARKNNIKVIPVGGISAAITALSASGLETDKFTFQGFFPRETKEKTKLITNLKETNIKTHIFYESPKRIIKTLEYLEKNLENITVSLFKELTKIHEKNYYGNITKILEELKQDEKSSNGEYTLIIEITHNTKKQEEQISKEALIIDKVIKENISIKEAIEILNQEYKDISKKDLYSASLNIKNILNTKHE